MQGFGSLLFCSYTRANAILRLVRYLGQWQAMQYNAVPQATADRLDQNRLLARVFVFSLHPDTTTKGASTMETFHTQ
jgi:hypothetical protein